jgi:hypothetical protein
MTDIIKATEHSLSNIPAGIEAFEAFADEIAPQRIVGRLLKFSKGDWIAGENNEPPKQTALPHSLSACTKCCAGG